MFTVVPKEFIAKSSNTILYYSGIMVFGIILFAFSFVIFYIITQRHYNKEIAKIAYTDKLTGVRNRTTYENHINSLSAKLGQNIPIGIGVLDLNGLKVVNDTYGHAAGDDYIVNACRIICKVFGNFAVFRIGGDEFSVIFDGTPCECISRLEQELQSAVEEFNKTSDVDLGIAFGYSYYNISRDKNIEEVFRRADANMYVNKKKQKNIQGQDMADEIVVDKQCSANVPCQSSRVV